MLSESDFENAAASTQQIVVKICTIGDEVRQESVENERRVLKKLPKSAHVANLLDYHEDPVAKKAYLVLERAGDLSLERLVQNNPKGLPPDQVKLIARQLSEAVKFLHENQIAHRDIKPDNIMLTQPELALKLIDFNTAHDLQVCPEIKGANGLRGWSAPETRKFQSYDERCDLWSVGCVLYYACTGSAPVHEEDSLELSDDLIV